MISNVTGYKYLVGDDIDAGHPHGDLDRISITGSNHAVVGGPIYGEPVAWTMECLLARDAAFDWYLGPVFSAFTRVISGYQMNQVTKAFNAMNAYPFVYPTQLTSARTANRVSTTIEEALPEAFNWTRYGRHLVEVVSSGDPVKAKPVDDMTFYMSDFGRGVMKAYAGNRDLGPYAGISLSGSKYEEGGYRVQNEPSDFTGRRQMWAANGVGRYMGGAWSYAVYDYRLNENSTIVIHADEEELRHIDSVRPVFHIKYDDSLQYSDTGFKFDRHYHSVYVSGQTYRFDANGDVTISAADPFHGFSPETTRAVYLPESGHEDDANYYMTHSESIEHVWLIGSLKADVVNR